MISPATELAAANKSAETEEAVFSGPLAMLFGAERPPARPAAAPIRAHRIHVNAAKTPDLPPIKSAAPAVLRAQQQREEVYQLLVANGGAMRRQDIAAATDIAEMRVLARLGELKELGLVRMEKRGQLSLWEAVDPDEEEVHE